MGITLYQPLRALKVRSRGSQDRIDLENFHYVDSVGLGARGGEMGVWSVVERQEQSFVLEVICLWKR